MGRPINKKYFGATGSGTTQADGANIPIRFKSGGTVYEGFIVKQVGSRRFKCSTDDGTTAVAICVTVDAGASLDPTNNGECVLVGFQATGGATGFGAVLSAQGSDTKKHQQYSKEVLMPDTVFELIPYKETHEALKNQDEDKLKELLCGFVISIGRGIWE
jgi:hypothetical protein